MSAWRIQDVAGHRIDEIYFYTCETWGEAQAEAYIRGLFDRFDAIAARHFPWRPIPAEFYALEVSGTLCRIVRRLPGIKVCTIGNRLGWPCIDCHFGDT